MLDIGYIPWTILLCWVGFNVLGRDGCWDIIVVLAFLFQVKRVRCEASGVLVPKDKAIKRFIVRNIVDASAIRDIQDSSVFDGEQLAAAACSAAAIISSNHQQQCFWAAGGLQPNPAAA